MAYPVRSDFPPGAVGFTGGEVARYHAFTVSWSGLQMPAHSREIPSLGYDTSANSNELIRKALYEPNLHHPEQQDAWVFIMDDDHTFEPELLLKLLAHDVDIVVPLYAQRQPPFLPCVYREESPEGGFLIHHWQDFDGLSGLQPIVSAGKAGVLIRRHVLETLKDPWFEWNKFVGEDHYFFKKAREAGFKVYVDLDAQMEHMTPMAIQPHRSPEGQWWGRVAMGRDVFADFKPLPQPG